MPSAEMNALHRRVMALEVAKSANPPPEKPALPDWVEENLSDAQAIIDDLADRVLSDRGDHMDAGWFSANRNWEDTLPGKDVIRYFLRDRMSRSPDGRPQLPHNVACELIGLLSDWFHVDSFEQGLDIAWQCLHFFPPVPTSRSLVERLWPGAVSPPWERRLHQSYVPLPGQSAVPHESQLEAQ
jgi:hypothetical protein